MTLCIWKGWDGNHETGFPEGSYPEKRGWGGLRDFSSQGLPKHLKPLREKGVKRRQENKKKKQIESITNLLLAFLQQKKSLGSVQCIFLRFAGGGKKVRCIETSSSIPTSIYYIKYQQKE